MGGVPDPSIHSVWNKVIICIEMGWSEEQYDKASKKFTQAITTVISARARKQKAESEKQNG